MRDLRESPKITLFQHSVTCLYTLSAYILSTPRRVGVDLYCMYLTPRPMSKQKTSVGIALDTCVIRNMLENPNYADMLSMHVNLRGRTVHICSRVVYEASQQDMDVERVVGKLEGLGASVELGEVTEQMQADAKAMEARYPSLLHWPDSDILAYTKAHHLVLLTRDRGLEAAAEMEDVAVINPDKLCGTSNRPRSSYEHTATVHSRRPPPDHAAPACRKRRRRNLPRRAAPLRA